MIYSYLILGALAIVTGVHLYHSWKDDKNKRRYTKPFLLLLIIAYYAAAYYEKNRSFAGINAVLIVALVTSWLGDVLLMPSGNKWFIAGGSAFLVSHISFIFVYAGNIAFDKVLWAAVIPAGLIYYAVSVLVCRALLPTTPKMMKVPMLLYLFCNSTMNVFALMQLTSLRTPGAVVAYCGAVLFFASDCTLYMVRYYKKDVIFKKHFTVMLTYVLGELMITQGVFLLG